MVTNVYGSYVQTGTVLLFSTKYEYEDIKDDLFDLGIASAVPGGNCEVTYHVCCSFGH